ncbi:MAG: hypothetical protein EB078_00975 [Proteobacteria bacterium]|nr:hypothetical protein [Pseudomonadota bacterium]NDC23288.1 hypothetical protein [Pseudomonadota bacterium]NDD03451.1 hypothetical protein [Pseudomonadota bacterium]NDG25882.1 hypothetical protein [Pseudomonadota bacterium]
MIYLNRLFSSPITLAAKQTVVYLLGFESRPFVFCEIVDGLVLRALQVTGSQLESLLEPKAMADRLSWIENQPLPVVTLIHETGSLVRDPNPVTPLWKFLLPFPWNRLQGATSNHRCKLEFSCGSFQSDWNGIISRFEEIQNQLSKSELGCLFLDGPSEASGVLLFRYVRGQIVSSSFLSPPISSAQLEKNVGTTVARCQLDKNKQSNLLGFSVAHAVLDSAIHSLKFFSPLNEQPQDALRFEL